MHKCCQMAPIWWCVKLVTPCAHRCNACTYSTKEPLLLSPSPSALKTFRSIFIFLLSIWWSTWWSASFCSQTRKRDENNCYLGSVVRQSVLSLKWDTSNLFACWLACQSQLAQLLQIICYSAYVNDERLQFNIAQLGGLEKEMEGPKSCQISSPRLILLSTINNE